MDKIKLMVVAGPTASGKSDLAIQLAQKFNGEIISADSRQVYQGMDIGTGKVTKKEQKLARHWMLDVANPRRTYTVARYTKAAAKAIIDITRRGKLPIICGGTGFYVDALIYEALFPNVKPNAKFRAKLSKNPTEWLYAQLADLDPVRAKTIDYYNRRRLIRALEIIEATKEPIPKVILKSPYTLLYMAISLPNDELAQRIERRLDARLKHGMIAEVRRLHASGISYQRLESFGLEYRWIARYLQGQYAKQDMRNNLLRDSVKYAKRQMTWFRRNPDVAWITGPAQAMRLARKFINH